MYFWATLYNILSGSGRIIVQGITSYDYGVCFVDYTKYSDCSAVIHCLSCHSKSCIHTNRLNKLLQTPDLHIPESSPLQLFKTIFDTPPSCRPYKVPISSNWLPVNLHETGHDRDDSDLKSLAGLYPSVNGQCTCGEPLSSANRQQLDHNCFILLEKRSLSLPVFKLVCSCTKEHFYTGDSDAIAYFGYYGVSIAVVKTAIDSILVGSMTMYTTYKKIILSQSMDNSNIINEMKYAYFRMAILGILK